MTPLGTARFPGALALAFALLPCACSSHSSSGVHVELMSERSVVAGEDLAAGTGLLRVEELRWTSTEIELLGCPSAFQAVARWLLPEAHAHGESTSTLSATPVIVNAVGTDSTRIGNLLPPAGRYCSLRYQIGPADGDALGLSTAPHMRDQSFWLRGAAGPAGGELQPFELISQRVLDVTVPVDLELSADQPERSVQFWLDSERWLAGLDAAALAAGGGEDALLEAFRASLSARVE
ncbi:MAG: hypothetical protein RL685_5125 [Pseudomonadota bacterium]|jgi:hypothetical protein